MVTTQLGEILLSRKLISQAQLTSALRRKNEFGGRLASACLGLGYLDEKSLASILAQQLGVPFVVLGQSKIRLALVQNFPLEKARSLRALPVYRDEDKLIVAMADPTHKLYLDEIRFITGSRVSEHGALIGPLQETIEASHLLLENQGSQFYTGKKLASSKIQKPMDYIEVVFGQETSSTNKHNFINSVKKILGSSLTNNWATQTVTKQPTIATAHKKTVLVVDDDDSLRAMLVTYLQKSGFHTTESADGRKALEMLLYNLPDAIVLDAMLPGVHGFEICRRVKRAQATKHIPVIMVSAIYRGGNYNEQVRLYYGANAYIEKPLKLSFLKQVIDNCLKVSSPPSSPIDISKQVPALLSQAVAAYRGQNLNRAIAHFQQAIEIAPFFASIHHKLALVFLELGQMIRGISQLEQAVELEPSFLHLLHLAKAYEQTGFVNKAIETYSRSIKACNQSSKAKQIQLYVTRLQKIK